VVAILVAAVASFSLRCEFTVIRKILAIVLGYINGAVWNGLWVTLSQKLYPFPPGIDPNDFEAVREHIAISGWPTGALLLVLVAHAGGSLASGLTCGLIAGRRWYVGATILGVLWTLGGVAMLMLLPAPWWFAVADVVLYLPAALLGVHLAGGWLAPPPPQVVEVAS
jgi:hypothetical protein